MISENSYYEGNVKSLGNQLSGEKFTVGIIEPGEYSFKTSSLEIMEIVHGEMNVTLPSGSKEIFGKGDSFKVEKESEFFVSVNQPVSYLCIYR